PGRSHRPPSACRRSSARHHREGSGPDRGSRRHRRRPRRRPHPARRGCSRQRSRGGALRQALLRFGEWLGVLGWVLRIRRAVALDGLRRAFPALSERERKKIGRASYVQLGRSLAEILLPLRDEELARAVRFDPWELLHPGPGPEGVVAAVAHYGNFELEARAAARRGLKLTIIARTL